MNQRFRKRFAPISFYVTAHINTMRVFCTGVGTNKRTLAALVDDTSLWLHFWTSYNPAASADVENLSTTRPQTHGQPDLAPDVRSEIDRQEMMRRQQQSNRDNARHSDRGRQETATRQVAREGGSPRRKRKSGGSWQGYSDYKRGNYYL